MLETYIFVSSSEDSAELVSLSDRIVYEVLLSHGYDTSSVCRVEFVIKPPGNIATPKNVRCVKLSTPFTFIGINIGAQGLHSVILNRLRERLKDVKVFVAVNNIS